MILKQFYQHTVIILFWICNIYYQFLIFFICCSSFISSVLVRLLFLFILLLLFTLLFTFLLFIHRSLEVLLAYWIMLFCSSMRFFWCMTCTKTSRGLKVQNFTIGYPIVQWKRTIFKRGFCVKLRYSWFLCQILNYSITMSKLLCQSK